MHVLVHVSPLLLLGLMALDHHGLVATSRHPAGIQTQRIRVSNSKQNSVYSFSTLNSENRHENGLKKKVDYRTELCMLTFRCMIYASKWRTDVLVHTSSNLALVLYLHFMISCFYDPCLTSSLSGPTVMLILFLWVIKNFYLQNNQFCWKKQKTLLKIIEGTLDHHSKTTSGKSIYIVRKHKPQWIHFSLLIPPHWLFYSFAFC